MAVYDNLDLTDREYLQRTLERVREAIAETLALLTGRDFALGEPRFDISGPEELYGIFPEKSVVAKGKFAAGIEGNLSVVFTGEDAITVTGTIAELSEQDLEAQIGEGVTPAVLGRFEEVAKQIFSNVGAFLTRMFDAEMVIDLDDIEAVDISKEQGVFTSVAHPEECVIVLFHSEPTGAIAMLIPLGVAKELSAIGLPGLPRRSPVKKPDAISNEDSFRNISRLMRLDLPIIVKLAEKVESLDKILNFSEGHIIEFDKSSDEMLELLIVDKLIAKGEAVKIGENFGIRIKEVGSAKETLEKLR